MLKRFKVLTAAGLAVAASAAMAQDTASQPKDTHAAAEAADTAISDAAVVQAHVDTYRTGDLDAFVATFTEDARVEANGIVAVGHAQIRAFYALNFKPGAPKIKVVDSGMSGPNVFLNVGYVFKGGRELCCSYSEYTVENGKISQLVAIG